MALALLEALKTIAENTVESAGNKLESIKQVLKDIKDEPESGLKELGQMVKDEVKPDLYAIQNLSIETIKEEVKTVVEGVKDGSLFRELTEEEKKKIKEETGWSDEIVNAMGSWAEYQIYKKAGLKEAEIEGRKCLIRDDIDWDQKDAEGRTNRERVNLKPPEGPLVPINENGEKIELHHIGQHADSPFAELTMKEHRGKENYAILHDTMKEESEIDRAKFKDERDQHWQARASQGGNT